MKKTSKITKLAFIFGIGGVFMLDILLPLFGLKIFIPMTTSFLLYNILQFTFSKINKSNHKIMTNKQWKEWIKVQNYQDYLVNAKDKRSSFSLEMFLYALFTCSSVFALTTFIVKNY